MGWLYTQGQTKKELVDHLTNMDYADGRTHECLAHSTRGNILWSVWKHEQKDGRIITVIHCDLLSSQRDYGWGYKGMCEEVHPYYYTCPLKYLDMAYDYINSEWREKVREYHKNKANQAKHIENLKVGDVVELIGSTIPRIAILSVSPLRGYYLGTTYKIPRKMIGEKLIDVDEWNAEYQGKFGPSPD